MNMRMLRGFGSQGLGTLTFTIETKRANLPAVLEILRQILREPSLPGSEFEVMKNEEIAGVRTGPVRSHAPGPQPHSAPAGQVSQR